MLDNVVHSAPLLVHSAGLSFEVNCGSTEVHSGGSLTQVRTVQEVLGTLVDL